MVKGIQNRGYYPYVTTRRRSRRDIWHGRRSDELFLRRLKTLERWIEYADQKLAG